MISLPPRFLKAFRSGLVELRIGPNFCSASFRSRSAFSDLKSQFSSEKTILLKNCLETVFNALSPGAGPEIHSSQPKNPVSPQEHSLEKADFLWHLALRRRSFSGFRPAPQ